MCNFMSSSINVSGVYGYFGQIYKIKVVLAILAAKLRITDPPLSTIEITEVSLFFMDGWQDWSPVCHSIFC